jgi:hypothetical protein
MKRPPFPTKQDLVLGYIEMDKAPHGSAAHEEAFWAFGMMDDLVEEFPEEAFDVIKRILDADESGEVVGGLAAGPIEDLLYRHGEKMIDAIENEARCNPKFNDALGGVWQSGTRPEIWKRVQAIRKAVW